MMAFTVFYILVALGLVGGIINDITAAFLDYYEAKVAAAAALLRTWACVLRIERDRRFRVAPGASKAHRDGSTAGGHTHLLTR